MKRRFSPLFALALAAGVALADESPAAAAPSAPAPAPATPAVAVQVDGEPAVMVAEVDRLVRIQRAMNPRLAGMTLPPEQERAIRHNCADTLLTTWLLRREAARKGVTVTDEEFAAHLAAPGVPDPAEFSAHLHGAATPEEIREDMRNALLVRKVLEPLTNSIAQPTEEEVRARFDRIVAANPDALKRPEQVTAAHVLVLVPADAPAEQDAAALAKINGIRDRALAGEDFGKLAAEFSEDPGSKDKGGVYTFGRGRMVKPFEDAAFSQPVGEIGEPIRTNYGYHVLKVLERTEPGTIAFEDVRANISAALFREAAERAAAEHVKALRDAARIEFVSEAVVSDPVQVPAP